MWHRLAHRVGRFVASADRRRGQVSQRLEHKNSDSPFLNHARAAQCLKLSHRLRERSFVAQSIRPELMATASTYFNFRKTTIYGGSNEVQRNIVSQTVLGA